VGNGPYAELCENHAAEWWLFVNGEPRLRMPSERLGREVVELLNEARDLAMWEKLLRPLATEERHGEHRRSS
jgi:hypothetical protein